MKILYVIHQFYPEFHSGTEKFLLNLASSVQRSGHFVQVVTYTYFEPGQQDRVQRNLTSREYVYQGVPVTAVRHNSHPMDLHTSCGNDDIYRFAFEYFKKEGPFDFIHFAHPMRLTSFADAAMDLGIPYGITLTDFWMLCPYINLQTNSGYLCAGPEGGKACEKLCSRMKPGQIKSRLERSGKILSEARILVSPSKFLAAVFRKEFPDLNLHIIPHGLEFQYLKKNSKRYQRLDPVTFAYCGNLAPHKGVHLLLDAFLKLNLPNGNLKLYGSSFHEKDYFGLLQNKAGNDPRIQFCGTYTNRQVGDIFSDIDVLVLPSLCYENYPLVLHEALACGVPVIASDAGGMAEKIEDGANGYTFRFGSEDDLAGKMRLILENPEILNHLKRNAEECLLPPVEEEAYQYERLYMKIIAESAE